MSWADKYVEMLREGSNVQFRPQGKSMEPLIKSGQLVTMRPVRTLGDAQVGNMVLCKVGGSYYLHLVSALDENKRIQISNNQGHVNGWTTLNQVFGVVTKVE